LGWVSWVTGEDGADKLLHLPKTKAGLIMALPFLFDLKMFWNESIPAMIRTLSIASKLAIYDPYAGF
jgi:hypothetical protein